VRDGRKIPAGRAAPNVTAVSSVFVKALTSRSTTVGVELFGLDMIVTSANVAQLREEENTATHSQRP
jgi:hypothetical protein